MPFSKVRSLSFLLPLVFFLSACDTVDLYEKNTAIPGHAWKSSFKPQFSFQIKDTSTTYNIYVVLRHNERYNYNNIWINLSTLVPGDTATRKVQYELPLANNEGWIGKETAMDDLYEHRILITPKAQLRAGEYKFVVEQIMREDPLDHVMNVGLRIEKNIKP